MAEKITTELIRRQETLLSLPHGFAGTQGLGLTSAFFPGHKQRSGLEVEHQGHELGPIWDTGATGRKLACYTTTSAPG